MIKKKDEKAMLRLVKRVSKVYTDRAYDKLYLDQDMTMCKGM